VQSASSHESNLTGGPQCPEFSQDGRIVISGENQFTTYEVDPALVYRSFAHPANRRFILIKASIRRDGRLLAVGTDGGVLFWDPASGRELPYLAIGNAPHFGRTGYCFSPEARHLLVQDADNILRLVETESGRTVARLESPDSCGVTYATFSPDWARLVVTTQEGPAVHVWNLRAIRRRLAAMGLDWDAPA
jgi:WD40 repeat protein